MLIDCPDNPLQASVCANLCCTWVCRKHKGNENAALGLVMEASSNGGVMRYLQLVEGLCTVPPPMQLVADACDRQVCFAVVGSPSYQCSASILAVAPVVSLPADLLFLCAQCGFCS